MRSCTVDGEAITVHVGGRVIQAAVDPADTPPDFRVPNQYEPAHADRSDRLRFTLERLAREQGLTRIEFGVRGGLAFRAVQAKRAGLAFAGVTLAARLDSCGKWERERRQRWPGSFAEVEIDFAERFAFENADERVYPDQAMLDFVTRAGWEASVAHASGSDGHPVVTIGIAHYNLDAYLPDTLASLAAQTYPHLDVIVIDDGSTDARSLAVFEQMRAKYPGYRFLRQPNAGIGATRNRCLELARGEFFLPVDADNLARPHMVERFVTAIRRNQHLAAMTCYFLAFEDDPARPHFAGRPAGGPHPLAAIRNVYGDANAIFRTAALRAVGGYETDRGTSCEDWEAFVKLVNAGRKIGVVPEHLFHYRHRPGGFSRATNWFANHQRVLRQFTRGAPLPAGDAEVLWTALLGFHLRLQELEHTPPPLRHRLADRLYAAAGRGRGLLRGVKRLLTCRRPVAACRASP